MLNRPTKVCPHEEIGASHVLFMADRHVDKIRHDSEITVSDFSGYLSNILRRPLAGASR
jgi:hypothetical protein